LLTNYDEVSDVTQYNKNLVNIYLQSKQNSKDNIRYKDWFMPTDIVNILNEKG
jgi:hypothetical protein